jgi:hypothetical protein
MSDASSSVVSVVEPAVAEIKPYLMFNGNSRQALEFYLW